MMPLHRPFASLVRSVGTHSGVGCRSPMWVKQLLGWVLTARVVEATGICQESLVAGEQQVKRKQRDFVILATSPANARWAEQD